jgi:hypothetical protein
MSINDDGKSLDRLAYALRLDLVNTKRAVEMLRYLLIAGSGITTNYNDVLEVALGADLNGDGVIGSTGLPPTYSIDAAGLTSEIAALVALSNLNSSDIAALTATVLAIDARVTALENGSGNFYYSTSSDWSDSSGVNFTFAPWYNPGSISTVVKTQYNASGSDFREIDIYFETVEVAVAPIGDTTEFNPNVVTGKTWETTTMWTESMSRFDAEPHVLPFHAVLAGGTRPGVLFGELGSLYNTGTHLALGFHLEPKAFVPWDGGAPPAAFVAGDEITIKGHIRLIKLET